MASQIGEPLERFLMLYCFPAQLLIGLTGNGLNLLVLTHRRMRSGTNWLLAMVALADSLFLLAFLPHTFRFNHTLRDHLPVRLFILYANRHITALVNACAFASAWFVVAVSLERMWAIRWPLRARGLWRCSNLGRLVLAIWAFALAISSHSHFTHGIVFTARNETSVDPLSGRLEMKQRWSGQSTIRPGWERLWGWLTAGSVLFGVLLPVLLVLLANLAIWEELGRERRRHRPSAGSTESTTGKNGHISPNRPSNLMGQQQRQGSSPPPPPPLSLSANSSPAASLLPRPSNAQLRHQRRATLSVLVIASTFTLCQTPSALVILWEVCWPPVGQLSAFRTAAVLSNFLVVTGKTANHFLLCLWSAHFRQMASLVLGQVFQQLPGWARPSEAEKKSPRPPPPSLLLDKHFPSSSSASRSMMAQQRSLPATPSNGHQKQQPVAMLLMDNNTSSSLRAGSLPSNGERRKKEATNGWTSSAEDQKTTTTMTRHSLLADTTHSTKANGTAAAATTTEERAMNNNSNDNK